MVAEAAVKLVERFGSGDPGETPKRTELLDVMERRERSDKRARNRNLRDRATGATAPYMSDSGATDPEPIDLDGWTDPADVGDIDWDSPEYDIVTVKEF